MVISTPSTRQILHLNKYCSIFRRSVISALRRVHSTRGRVKNAIMTTMGYHTLSESVPAKIPLNSSYFVSMAKMSKSITYRKSARLKNMMKEYKIISDNEENPLN